MAWISLSSVSVSNGDLTVSVTGSVDLSGVLSGWALIINNNYVEIKSGTFADINGNSTLTLSEAWDGSTITNQPAKIMPTSAPQLEIAQLMTDTNEYAIDVHNTLTEIATEDKDVTIADNTGTEHTFASMPKNSRLVQEAIQSGSDELASITADIKSQLEKYSVSKGDFFALAEQRKRESAGSGFLEWGKERTISGVNEIVASGLWTGTSTANTLSLGRGESSFEGVSRSDYPVALVNGVRHKLYGTNSASPSYNPVAILFPDTELGTRSYDSTAGEVIDYLTDVSPIEGDVASDANEAVARNFQGLVQNGDFRDSSGPGMAIGTIGVISEDGVLTVTNDSDNFDFIYWGNLFEGDTVSSYEVTVVTGDCGGNGARLQQQGSTISLLEDNSTTTLTFSELNNGSQLRLATNAAATGAYAKFKFVSVHKVGTKPITSRQDYCFLESWHEAVSSKDIFCPLGNAQYGAATSEDEGISLSLISDLGIDQGYSAFGGWDTATEGYVAKWSELTTAEQRACLDNPDNNLYFDNEADELIQVRYRIRVIKGVGDNWENARSDTSNSLSYNDFSNARIRQKGMYEAASDLVPASGYGSHVFYGANTANSAVVDTIAGQFSGYGSNTAYAFNGLCFALPICLVQRGNQGAYHPVYNPNGFRRWNRVDYSGSVFWYDETAYSPSSTVDCFLLDSDSSSVGANAGTGSIDKATGRTDQYEYYDAIYAGQLQDLRLNANKQDPNRLMEDAIRKAVAGETRGKNKQVFSTVYDDAGGGESSVASYKYNYFLQGGENRLYVYTDLDTSEISVGDVFYLYNKTTGLVIKGTIAVTTVNYNFRTQDGLFEVISGELTLGNEATDDEVYYIIEKELTSEYDSLPWVDIVGSPENILATFPNGVVGQWIPQLPDGSAADYPANKKIYGDAKRIYTLDYGDTWTASVANADTILNTFTDNTPTYYVGLVHYEAPSSFTETDANTAVYGKIGDVVSGCSYDIGKGNRLQPTLTDMIGSGGYTWCGARSNEVQAYAFQNRSIEATSNNPPTHDTLRLLENTGVYDTPAFKALYHLIEKDGLLYMQYHGRELQHNGTDWGDDSTVPIVDNESTMLDDNGNTVKTFTHTEIFPIGIADYTQTN